MVMLYSSAAAITSASALLPPAATCVTMSKFTYAALWSSPHVREYGAGLTTYATPRDEATSIESRKGKKASDAKVTPSRVFMNSAFSLVDNGSGSLSN
mmetsp:Transcript_5034/g.12847  ORF Transcript_5034/g.12847 Transcript_5034/m.12847 type:complete len:98 (-) Transcript_5034:1556-1849(-)